MLRDAKLHPDVALVNGISVLLTLLEVRKGRFDYKYISCIVPHIIFETLSLMYKTILIILNLHVLMLISVGKVKNQ